jgi:hypothetical protein
MMIKRIKSLKIQIAILAFAAISCFVCAGYLYGYNTSEEILPDKKEVEHSKYFVDIGYDEMVNKMNTFNDRLVSFGLVPEHVAALSMGAFLYIEKNKLRCPNPSHLVNKAWEGVFLDIANPTFYNPEKARHFKVICRGCEAIYQMDIDIIKRWIKEENLILPSSGKAFTQGIDSD